MTQRVLRAESLEPRAMLSATSADLSVNQTVQPMDPQPAMETVTPQLSPQAPALAGDFNGDHVVNAIDIDMLTANLGGETKSNFDLTADGLVDRQDMDMLIRDIIGTEYGDADLDGYVGPWDAVTMFRGFLFGATGWAAGDFSCDGVVDGQDFIIWNQHKFTETRMQQALGNPNQSAEHADTNRLNAPMVSPPLVAPPTPRATPDHDSRVADQSVPDQGVAAPSKLTETPVRRNSVVSDSQPLVSAGIQRDATPSHTGLRLRLFKLG